MKNNKETKNIFHNISLYEVALVLSTGFFSFHLLKCGYRGIIGTFDLYNLKVIKQNVIDNREKQK